MFSSTLLRLSAYYLIKSEKYFQNNSDYLNYKYKFVLLQYAEEQDYNSYFQIYFLYVGIMPLKALYTPLLVNLSSSSLIRLYFLISFPSKEYLRIYLYLGFGLVFQASFIACLHSSLLDFPYRG